MKPMAVIILICASACAQEHPKTFWTAGTVASQLVNIVAASADVYSTREALRIPGARETNPLVSSAGITAVKLGAIGASLALSYSLHRSHHDRIAKIIPLAMSVPQFVAVGRNAKFIGGQHD